MSDNFSPFADILNGVQPGKIIAQDEERRLALIESIEPEAAVHWLAVPFEEGIGIEELKLNHQQRFLDLVDFAITQTKALSDQYPLLENGFSIKFHVGSFETVAHAKLHILSSE